MNVINFLLTIQLSALFIVVCVHSFFNILREDFSILYYPTLLGIALVVGLLAVYVISPIVDFINDL